MPRTLHLHAADPAHVEQAALLLRRGGLVAFPTETVYGLGANALNAEAVSRIFSAKGRPAWDPLIVHVADVSRLPELTRLDEQHGEQLEGQTARQLAGRVHLLAAAFWPGPLTLLLPRSAAVPDEVTAGRSRVGVRVPAHDVAQALLRRAGVPVAAPSANRFGHVSPTTAAHVLDDLDGRIDAVLDGGPCRVGVESTVLDPAATPMLVYRAGAVTPEAIAAATGAEVRLFVAPGDAPPSADRVALPSPGVGLRHYAPETPLQLTGPTALELGTAAASLATRGKRVCLLQPEDWQIELSAGMEQVPWGRWSEPASLAAGLFAALRSAEATSASIILCPVPEPGGLGDALRDRLFKAAMPRSQSKI